MYITIKCVSIFLLLEIFCFSFSQSHGHYRWKRIVDETTTAEPKYDSPKKININTSTTKVQNLSTTTAAATMVKITKNLDTTTPISLKNTTESTNNVRYSRASTTNSYHTTSMTTATPKIVVESTRRTSARQFDILSFFGGCLLTFCLTGIGIFGWKMYALHLERSYRTI